MVSMTHDVSLYVEFYNAVRHVNTFDDVTNAYARFFGDKPTLDSLQYDLHYLREREGCFSEEIVDHLRSLFERLSAIVEDENTLLKVVETRFKTKIEDNYKATNESTERHLAALRILLADLVGFYKALTLLNEEAPSFNHALESIDSNDANALFKKLSSAVFTRYAEEHFKVSLGSGLPVTSEKQEEKQHEPIGAVFPLGKR